MSFNHYSLGAVDDVLYRRVAGIAPAEPGFRQVRVAPLTDGPLSWARASRETPYGRVEVRWERGDDGEVRYDVALPAGVTGELVGPSGDIVELPPGAASTTLR